LVFPWRCSVCLPAFTVSGELLHPRHPADRRPPTPGLLRRLRHDRHGHHLLLLAEAAWPRVQQPTGPAPGDLVVLGDEPQHAGHHPAADLGWLDPDRAATPAW